MSDNLLSRCEEIARRGHAALDSGEYDTYYTTPRAPKLHKRYNISHHGTGWTGHKIPCRHMRHDG